MMPAEIRALPLEIQVCFFLQPWKGTAPSSIQDWAEKYGWVHAYSDVPHTDASGDRAIAVQRAVLNAERVLVFVREVVDAQRTSGA